MANLVSPGVQVSVTDESVYGPAGAGTVPMLFIATGENKVDPTGTETDGIAKYTKAANAGKPVLVTSQRELTQYFGNIDFRTVAGSVAQADETNDYGLLAAYSFLGQSAAAFVVRANVDTVGLRPADAEPVGNPANNTYWLNPTASNYGVFEYTAGGWSAVTPNVEITAGGSPATAVVNGEYLVVVDNGTTTTSVQYLVGEGGSWIPVGSGAATATFAPHYSVPTAPAVGDIWVKTTVPGAGVNLAVALFTDTAGQFVSKSAVYAQETVPTGIAFNSDGTKMFITGNTGDDVNEYTLSTGFDVSTATYSQNFSVSAQDTIPNGIDFNTDGTKMFISGSAGDSVYEYTLSTGFNVSTATYSQSFSFLVFYHYSF